MNTDLKQLLEEITKYQNDDNINDELFDKINGKIRAGSKIEIFWIDRNEPDKGYIFILPNQNIDELDVCVHVPMMDNSDGIGYGEEVFRHLYSVVSLERVSKIEVIRMTAMPDQ